MALLPTLVTLDAKERVVTDIVDAVWLVRGNIRTRTDGAMAQRRNAKGTWEDVPPSNTKT